MPAPFTDLLILALLGGALGGGACQLDESGLSAINRPEGGAAIDDDGRGAYLEVRLITWAQARDDDRHGDALIEACGRTGRGGEVKVSPRGDREAHREEFKSEVVP